MGLLTNNFKAFAKPWFRVWAFFALVLCFSLSPSYGQIYENLTIDDIKEELEKVDLDFDEVERELLLNGVDLNRIQDSGVMTIDQKETIQRVILRMVEEKKEESDEEEDASKQQTEEELPEDDGEEELEENLESELDSTLVHNTELETPEILIYGQELFRNNILSVSKKSDEINAPDTYVLGPGDKLVISIWGKTFLDEEHTIRSDGYIRVIGGKQRVFLKGLTLSTARSKIKQVLKNAYQFSDGQYDLKLNFSRTVRISIWGEVVENPGAMVLPAFNSAFNALSLVGGTNDIGSLRNIELRKSNGKKLIMDVYELLNDPSISNDYYLEDNDIILVPESENIITLTGAVKRPVKYELRKGEGVKELLEFSGGFSENAFRRKIQVTRFINDDQEIIDLNWRDFEKSGRNFELYNGDLVNVETIAREYRNFVEIVGEVNIEGQFQRENNMRILDLINKAGLTENSSRDLVYLTRTNADGTISYEKIDLNKIMADKNHPQNLILNDKDKLEIWSKERFVDNAEIFVNGSVRYEGKFPFDENNSITVRDAIILAGGLSRDASSIAIVHSNDPLNPKFKSYKTIDNLNEILSNPNLEENITLSPFDSLVVESLNTYMEESFVRIEGAVNKPGQYQFGEDMTIKDLLALAGGFKIAASTNNIEVSRVIISDNNPTETVVANLDMDRDFNVLSKGASEGEYLLRPYDNIAVRYIKDFELQKRVFLAGEVEVPGPYAIFKENLKISEVIDRAGGMTKEAFAPGATLTRNLDSLGAIVIKLDEIMRNPNSEFNFVVKNGDEIFIPKVSEFVTIMGATRVREVVSSESIAEGNLIRVPYHNNKDAMFYINEFAGGLDENADKSKIFVRYANGQIKTPSNGFLKKKFPKVQQGSVITVGYKSDDKVESEKKSDVDWTELLQNGVTQAMSILTLILLIQRLD